MPRVPECKPHWIALAVYSLILVLITAAITLGISSRVLDPEGESDVPSAFSEHRLPFGTQDMVVDSVTVPAGTDRPSLLYFDVDIEAVPTSSHRAALVSFRVDCSDTNGRIDMQSTGKLSTNMFLAQGGTVSGQALTSDADQKLECVLMASAPFAETTNEGLSSLSLRADLRTQSSKGTHMLAIHRLDDAALLEPGTIETVLSRQVDEPAKLARMSSTVRLTSCTVVGGSRDAGENKCRESMTGRESSTVRVRVIARWLDDEGTITGRTTYWDETLAIDYDTHHVPWTLRLADMGERAPESAEAVVMVVQVESIAGTPVVVHSDGTDSVITTHA